MEPVESWHWGHVVTIWSTNRWHCARFFELSVIVKLSQSVIGCYSLLKLAALSLPVKPAHSAWPVPQRPNIFILSLVLKTWSVHLGHYMSRQVLEVNGQKDLASLCYVWIVLYHPTGIKLRWVWKTTTENPLKTWTFPMCDKMLIDAFFCVLGR